MRIAQPARLPRGGAIGHRLQLVHVRGAAELDQHVEVVLGDLLRGVAGGDVRPPAVGRDLAGDEPLQRVLGPLVERVDEDLEALAINVVEERQGEVADRVLAQVRRHEAQPDLRANRPRRRLGDRPIGGGPLDAPAPDPVLLDELQAILVGVGLGELLQERRMASGLRPAAAQALEVADQRLVVEVADADQDLADHLLVRRSEFLGAGQDGQRELVALLDVRALIAGPGPLEALDQRHRVVELDGVQLDGATQVDVAAIAIEVADRRAELVVQPRRVRKAGQELLHIGFGAPQLTGAADHHAFGFQQLFVVRVGRDRPVAELLGLLAALLLV